MLRSESAGGLVVNGKGEIIVVRNRGGSYSFPKGHVEAGEGIEEAARREVKEETGLEDLIKVASLGSYERTNNMDASEIKTIHLFVFATRSTVVAPDDPDLKTQVQEALFLAPEEAVQRLTHPTDKEQVRRASAQIQLAANLLSDQGVLEG